MAVCEYHNELVEKLERIFSKLEQRKSSDDLQDFRLDKMEEILKDIQTKQDCLKKQISNVTVKVGIIMGVFSTIMVILQVLPTIKQILH